ncbi:hypothetical protein ACQY0O_008015 [Thecaphora frezii]
MRTSLAAVLLVGTAGSFPSCIASATELGRSTNLLWLVTAPPGAESGAATLTWALNATLSDHSVTFHHENASDMVIRLFEKGASASWQAPLRTIDPWRLSVAGTGSTIAGPASTSSRSSDADSHWLVSFRRAEPRPLKLKGKKLPKLSDEASDLTATRRWLLTAQATRGTTEVEMPLLEVTSLGSSADGHSLTTHFIVQPAGRELRFLKTASGWSSNGFDGSDATFIRKSWRKVADFLTPSDPKSKERSQSGDLVRSYVRIADGSYRQLLAQSFRRPDRFASIWAWSSALNAAGDWTSRFNVKGVSERVHNGCHKVHQVLQQASPFQGTGRPAFATLRNPIHRAQLRPSLIAKKAQDSRLGRALARPSAMTSDVFASLMRELARQWKEADGPKQTFMAVFAVLQLVWLACTIKDWLDRLFGRKVEYRNRRTKSLARKAALAAAGGCSAGAKRSRTWASGKPRLPPRPTAGHPLMPLGGSAAPTFSTAASQNRLSISATNELQTTPTGEIILPSWTENGPASLMVIVEEPELEKQEEEEARRRIYSHSKKRSDWECISGEWQNNLEEDERQAECLEQGWSSSNVGGADKWSSRLSHQPEGGSLRYRERREAASFTFGEDHARAAAPSTCADEAPESEPDLSWAQSDRSELERSWRDSCLEEGVFDVRH